MADNNLLDHVADIVSAHVSNNAVAMSDLASLIRSVHASLARLGQPLAPVEEERTPAVSVRASVKPDALTCLDCGVKMKMLKRHLSTDHGLTPAEYRERWSLPVTYPMVAAEYSAKRKVLALSFGLGRKPGQTVKPAAKAIAKTKPTAPKTPAVDVPATESETQVAPSET